MKVYAALAAELDSLGVRDVFSVPASETMKVTYELTRRGIAHHSARHEQVGVGMADGYWRSTGRVGVFLTGRGPGLTNGTNALITARKSGSGVLVLAGENSNALAADPVAAARDIMSMKTIDQLAFVRALGAVPAVFNSPSSAVADLRAAFEFSAAGNTVIALLRKDVAEEEAGDHASQVELPPLASYVPREPEPSQIALSADLLQESWAAKRPIILAGRGAVAADAVEPLKRLAEMSGALLATTLPTKGLFGESERAIGVFGTMSTPVALELIVSSDLLMVFGASLNVFTTSGGELLKDARLVCVDSHAAALSAHQSAADIAIHADAGLTARALGDELERRGHRAHTWLGSKAHEQLPAERCEWHVHDEGVPGSLDPRMVLLAIEAALPPDRCVVFDNGAHLSFGAKYLSGSDPASFMLTHDYGSVGAAFGIAIGAAAAHRDRLTVLEIGDGGFMMCVQDLDTAVRYRLPMLIVVLNDGAFGQEVHLLESYGLEPDLALYANPNLATVAQSLGADALRVESLGDLDGLKSRIAQLEGPFVLDVPINVDVRPDTVDLVMRLGHRHSAPAGAS